MALSVCAKRGRFVARSTRKVGFFSNRKEINHQWRVKSTAASLESNVESLQLIDRSKVRLHKLEDMVESKAEAVSIRRKLIAEENSNAESVFRLPSSNENFDVDNFYESIHGANCENVVGYLPVPVGVVGPLQVNDESYYVPMATTEGALLASANRGARAIAKSGGAFAKVLRDNMTRSPVVELPSTMEAAKFAEYVEKPENVENFKKYFASTTNFGQLEGVRATVAGKYCFLRFSASTGDAMGMNMVGKGCNVVMENILKDYPSVKLVALSSNMCTDKKPSAMNWVNGRGKSVVCEVRMPKEVVESVLGTTVEDIVKVNTVKNLVGSSLAGSIGGNNAHASNLVTAFYIATGQDPAQNVVSSNCMVVMESVEEGKQLLVSVTMPSVEVGTVGGGTTLTSQKACLEMLGVAGANRKVPGEHSKKLAEILAATVLAGELSLNAALASNNLISAHMDLNRKPTTTTTSVETPKPGFQHTQTRKITSLSKRKYSMPKEETESGQFIDPKLPVP
mmetsp:Transcript_14834/g.17339  ORF Transcript_14834/g.17339 Transcript_14834/m.17339 type:complete len:510 (-) Transcript_14834:2729-4258(-)